MLVLAATGTVRDTGASGSPTAVVWQHGAFQRGAPGFVGGRASAQGAIVFNVLSGKYSLQCS